MPANGSHREHGQSRDPHRANTLGLGDRELNELIDEFVSPKEPPVFERVFARWPFPTTSVPVKVLHPGGTEVELRLACRNLSRGGVGLLHGAFMHPGSRLAVYLPRRTGGEHRAEGVVARCLHRHGIVHEVGIAFDAPINIRDFIRPDLFEGWLSYERVKPAELEGSVLQVEPDEVDRRIVTRFLQETRVVRREAATGADGLAAAADSPDLILCSNTLTDMTGTEFVAKLRELGIGSPVVLVASAADDTARTEIRFSGASAFLSKPHDRKTILLAVAEFLLGGAEAEPPTPRASAAPRLAAAYAIKLGEYAAELDETIDDERHIDAYVICVQIKGTAPALGFPSIGDRAGRLADRIATGAKLRNIRGEFEALTNACRQLRRAA